VLNLLPMVTVVLVDYGRRRRPRALGSYRAVALAQLGAAWG
jgi:hypothetical protein